MHSRTCPRRGYYYFQLNLFICIRTQTSARFCTCSVQLCNTWGRTVTQTQTWTLLTNEHYKCWQLSMYWNTNLWAEHHIILVWITVKTCIFLPNPMQCFEKTVDSPRTQNVTACCAMMVNLAVHSSALQYVPNLHGFKLHVYMMVFLLFKQSWYFSFSSQ